MHQCNHRKIVGPFHKQFDMDIMDSGTSGTGDTGHVVLDPGQLIAHTGSPNWFRLKIENICFNPPGTKQEYSK